MNKFWCCLFLFFFGITSSFAQTISKTWNFQAVEDSSQNALFDVDPALDYLKLNEGFFELSLRGEEINEASGNYVYQNDVLVLFYNTPLDTIRNFRITSLTDSTMTMEGKNILYFLEEAPLSLGEVLPVETAKQMVPHAGISLSLIHL